MFGVRVCVCVCDCFRGFDLLKNTCYVLLLVLKGIYYCMFFQGFCNSIGQSTLSLLALI